VAGFSFLGLRGRVRPRPSFRCSDVRRRILGHRGPRRRHRGWRHHHDPRPRQAPAPDSLQRDRTHRRRGSRPGSDLRRTCPSSSSTEPSAQSATRRIATAARGRSGSRSEPRLRLRVQRGKRALLGPSRRTQTRRPANLQAWTDVDEEVVGPIWTSSHFAERLLVPGGRIDGMAHGPELAAQDSSRAPGRCWPTTQRCTRLGSRPDRTPGSQPHRLRNGSRRSWRGGYATRLYRSTIS
jgi:hypothetical protein